MCTQETGGGVSKLEGDTPEGGSASLRPQTGRLVSHSGPTCSVPQSLSACQAAAAAWWSCSCGLSAGRYWLLTKQNFEERKKKNPCQASVLHVHQYESLLSTSVTKKIISLTILLAIVSPLRTLVRVVCWNAKLKRWYTWEVLVIWEGDGKN